MPTNLGSGLALTHRSDHTIKLVSRPLRIEFPGALYHVTSRGDRREDIYADDIDRSEWMRVLEQVCTRFNWVVHAYCLMSNHYHLLVQTPDSNLSSQRLQRLEGQVLH